MSGAVEYLEEQYRDTEKIPVMTAPGAANELSRVLNPLRMVSTTSQCTPSPTQRARFRVVLHERHARRAVSSTTQVNDADDVLRAADATRDCGAVT